MSHVTTPAPRNGAGRNGRTDPLEYLALDQKLRDEMKALSRTNHELMGTPVSEPDIQLHSQGDANEIKELKLENARLRTRLADIEQVLEQAAAAEQSFTDRQKEFETILEEKSEVIRNLHLKIKDMQEGMADGSASKAAENEEIKKLKKEIAREREQIAHDEESLMLQMRQMEMAMSRDRAELARQRNELARLQAELNHEIEMASRDPGLRERLLSLQRRQQETVARKGGAASRPAPDAAAPAASGSQNIKKSGFFGRLFGK